MSETPVPRLDLAPKLKRPLSLLNPLDYLRLLYWVFYFPQALRWYMETFAVGENLLANINKTQKLSSKIIKRNFQFQCQILTIIIINLIGKVIENLGCEINWISMNIGLITLFIIPEIIRFATSKDNKYIDYNINLLVYFLPFSACISVISGSNFYLLYNLPSYLLNPKTLVDDYVGIAFYIIIFFLISIVEYDITNSIASAQFNRILIALSLSAIICVIIAYFLELIIPFMGSSILYDYLFGFENAEKQKVIKSIIPTGLMVISISRLDDWLISILNFNNKSVPHVSVLSFYRLENKLKQWIAQDWNIGLYNINQLLANSRQIIPIVKILNQTFEEIHSDEIIYRFFQLSETINNRELLLFLSATRNEAYKSLIPNFIRKLWLFLSVIQKEADENFILKSTLNGLTRWGLFLEEKIYINTRLDTPARATAAGFWYLHEKQPTKATKAFAVVRSLPYGEEMYTLAHTIAIFHQTKNFSAIANINPEIRNFPSSEPLLRPNTWQAINLCDRVIADAKVIQNSTSRASRAFALNRAIGELLQILDNPETIPEAERYLIIDIATTWKIALEKQALEVGQVEITKPVRNPYIVGDPVEGQLFVGRDDIMRQLEELWLMGTNMQSVVLYGHRRMGKTSILRNLSQRVGAGVKIAYVNLLGVGDVSQEGEVLMALSDAISQVVNIPPPNDEDLLNLPYPTFRRYLQRIINANNVNSDSPNNVETRYIASPPQTPPSRGLIIALDEFEKIEELIAAGKIPQSFMGYLRSLVQMSPKIGFILAGLHTLEEMTADYFQPLYASFTPPIKVSFMEPDATSVILANPGIDDFPLDYTPEALNKIYQITHGQPFLVQLVGFQLVRRYNDRTFAMKQNTNPIFTLDDVETVINDPVFFQRGRYYFDGVWSQALEGAAGQQTILQTLAPHPQGLTRDELVKTTGIDVANLESALQMLIRHDVVFEHQGHWQIIVELFRRWVLHL